MAFDLCSHSAHRVEIQNDDGDHFKFEVISSPSGQRELKIDDARSGHDYHSEGSQNILNEALRFATACAKDCGLT